MELPHVPQSHTGIAFWLLALQSLLLSWSTAEEGCFIPLRKAPEIEQANPYAFLGERINLTCVIEYDAKFAKDISNKSIVFESDLSESYCTDLQTVHFEKNDTLARLTGSLFIDPQIALGRNMRFFRILCSNRTNNCPGRTAQRRCNFHWSRTNIRLIPLEHFPLPVKNASCVVYDWLNMTCKWDLQQIYINGDIDTDISVEYADITDLRETGLANTTRDFTDVNYDVELSWTISKSMSRCKTMQVNGKWLTCTFSKENYANTFVPGPYFFRVSVSNNKRKVSAVRNMTINTNCYVQPAIVTNVSSSANRRDVSLHWIKERTWNRVAFRVDYISNWDDISDPNSWKKQMLIPKEMSPLEFLQAKRKNKNFQSGRFLMTLVDLIPNSQYTFRISSIPLVNDEQRGFWSDYVQIVERTLEDVPADVPNILPGFFHCLHPECTSAMLYWQPIPEVKRHGRIEFYRITVNKQVFRVSGSASSAIISLDREGLSTVNITQSTKEGYPVVPDAQIVIPSHIKKPPEPSNVLAVTFNSSYVKITWERVDVTQNHSYVIVRCRLHRDGNCDTPLEYKKEPPASNETVIASNPSTDLRMYKFGVTIEIEQNNFVVGSGITWSECTFIHDEVPKTSLRLEVVMTESISDRVRLKWKPYTCEESRGYLLNYTIRYCSMQSNCSARSKEMKEVMVSRSSTKHEISGLVPGKYRCWIRGNFWRGHGPTSEPAEFIIYSEKEERTEFMWLILVIILVLVFAGVILYASLRLRRACKEELEVKMPGIHVRTRKTSETGDECIFSDSIRSSSGETSSAPSSYGSDKALLRPHAQIMTCSHKSAQNFPSRPYFSRASYGDYNDYVTSCGATPYCKAEFFSSYPTETSTPEKIHEGNESEADENSPLYTEKDIEEGMSTDNEADYKRLGVKDIDSGGMKLEMVDIKEERREFHSDVFVDNEHLASSIEILTESVETLDGDQCRCNDDEDFSTEHHRDTRNDHDEEVVVYPCPVRTITISPTDHSDYVRVT